MYISLWKKRAYYNPLDLKDNLNTYNDCRILLYLSKLKYCFSKLYIIYYLSIYNKVVLQKNIWYSSIYLPIYLLSFLPINLLPTYLSSLSIFQPTYFSIHLSLYLFIHFSIYLSIYLFIYLCCQLSTIYLSIMKYCYSKLLLR